MNETKKLERLSMWRTVATIILVLCACTTSLRAAVNAQLSRAQTTVGVPVQFLIEVDGSTNVVLPQEIAVDGLQIQRTGQQTRVEIINFRMKTSAVYSYTVYPDREGVFEIPSVDVTVDGKRVQTRPVKLQVDAGSPGIPVQRALPVQPGQQAYPPGFQPPTAPPVPAEPGEEKQLAFAELILSKKEAFVGELVPVEVRFYFNQGYHFEIQGQRPSISGEGFTVQRLPDPQRGEQRIGNEDYHVLSFRTAITPLKSGQIELPSVTLSALTRVPMSSMGSIDDIFDQFFGGSGGPGMGQNRELAISTKPSQLTVKPLPKEGRPENFSGAVGEFTISSTAAPVKVEPGEPVTLTVSVAGTGNFDAMGDPVLVGDQGWRSYPPAQKFQADDQIGQSGRKDFEFALVAREPRNETPGAEFSFFNPESAQYVTLSAAPVAVQAAASNAAVAAATAESTAPDASTPAASDAGSQRPPAAAESVGPEVARGFSPWIRSGWAWVLNGVVALVILALLLAGWMRHRNATDAGLLQRRKRERAALLARVAKSGEGEFPDAVVAVLQFDAGLTGGVGAWDRVNALQDIPGHADAAARLREFLFAVDEARFGGGASQTKQSLAHAKAEILGILKKVCP
ncbi:MAG: BatD family protein [Chthoniobacterales bacterium]